MNEVTTGELGCNTNDAEETTECESKKDLKQALEQFSNSTTADRAAFQ